MTDVTSDTDNDYGKSYEKKNFSPDSIYEVCKGMQDICKTITFCFLQNLINLANVFLK